MSTKYWYLHVLLVMGGLLDVVSFVPPDPVGGWSEVYLSRVGEATLVLEIRDSITQTTLATAIASAAHAEFTLRIVLSKLVQKCVFNGIKCASLSHSQ